MASHVGRELFPLVIFHLDSDKIIKLAVLPPEPKTKHPEPEVFVTVGQLFRTLRPTNL